MQNWSQIANQAKDLLTVCLAKGIDEALTAQYGSDWFAGFAEAEAKEKVNTRITKPGHRSVQDMDLQALLKLLRYRSHLTRQILTHYGFFAGLDGFTADGQLQQLNNLLDRLINDFRNRIAAHARAADIEKELTGNGLDRIYGYEEAYQDMYKLTRIFGTVTDSRGVSYARCMAALTEKKKRWPLLAGIAAVLAVAIGLVFWLLPGKTDNAYRDDREAEVVKDQVAVQPVRVYYEDEELVAECYLVNGTDARVKTVDVNSFRITVDGKEVAAAEFGELKGVNLAPGASVKWRFRFPKETVFIYNAKLPDLEIEFQCAYE